VERSELRGIKREFDDSHETERSQLRGKKGGEKLVERQKIV